MGLVATMTALLLGLVTAAAMRSSFDGLIKISIGPLRYALSQLGQ